MYSDKWIMSNCTKQGSINITRDGLITYVLWIDNENNYVGAGLNFEYADDFHYEFLINDWERLMNCLFGVSNYDSHDKLLRAYFKDNDFFAFENALAENNIEYEKIAFY